MTCNLIKEDSHKEEKEKENPNQRSSPHVMGNRSSIKANKSQPTCTTVLAKASTHSLKLFSMMV